jgi:hypothetical protein
MRALTAPSFVKKSKEVSIDKKSENKKKAYSTQYSKAVAQPSTN